jgi:hypothetical protein
MTKVFGIFLVGIAGFFSFSCMAHNYQRPICKCECKCPSNNIEENKQKNKKVINENFLTDDTTIKDILGDR